MRRQPATANELYEIASHLGPIDADLVKSAADELVELRDEVNRLRSATAMAKLPTDAPLLSALAAYQQADADGVMVLVSRQACDVAIREIERLRRERDDIVSSLSGLGQTTMPKGPKGEKRPADVIGNAVKVMKIATGESEEDKDDDGKDKAAQSLGRRGGKARAEKMSPDQRAEIARRAAKSRWSK